MNIYPIFDSIQSRSDKEYQLHQRSITIWFTGLSGSGKSTIAIALEQRLACDGFICALLDGDNLRAGINGDLGFTAKDREENIRRTAHICRLFMDTGIIAIATLVTPTKALRRVARDIIGSHDMVEIYISTPLSECERRDTKGLYRAARSGKIDDFTGISAPFEPPQSADIEIDTTKHNIDDSVEIIINAIKDRIVYGL